jgi:hypothetical protein
MAAEADEHLPSLLLGGAPFIAEMRDADGASFRFSRIPDAKHLARRRLRFNF